MSLSGQPVTNVELVERLCTDSPALREMRRRHVRNFDVLIPHVFMADVLAHVGSLFRMGIPLADAPSLNDVRAVLASLEEGMKRGDRETRNVIALSFVSDGETEPFFPHLKPMLGTKLMAQTRGK
ncbi:MAG: hypothetical protein M3R58_09670 [Pseudomonadota bacterium]|nr:hypothetical protein [Pseudomonadota bacterium]